MIPHLLVERRGNIAIVTFNRPEKRNALSPEMMVRLAEFWREVAIDDAIRVIVVTGAGDKAFSSGGDLSSLIPLMMRTRPPVGEWEERFAADLKQFNEGMLRHANFFKPIIAAINGSAYAGGAEFISATDLRVMSSEATLGITEVRLGLIASGGSASRLARQISWCNAMELLLLGESISAHRALEMGLVNRVVPPDEVMPTALELARRVALGAPVALEKMKEVIVRGNGRPFEEAFAIEVKCTKENSAMDDAKEGARAFLEKRAPVFYGRGKK